MIRPPLLAHKASAEGIAAVEIMAGVREPGFDLLSIAGCIYCEPEVATVGLTEAQARERGIEVKVGKFPFRAIGKSVAINQTEGFVKIVASKEYSEVLGAQIIGHHATDLISEIVLGTDAGDDDCRDRQDAASASDAVRGDHGGGIGRRGRSDPHLAAQIRWKRCGTLEIARLGTVDYEAALALQDALVAARRDDLIGDTLLMLEHPHVFTLGRGADDRYLLEARPGVPVFRVSRGGQVTYHGPGQLVGYPILKLEGRDRDIHLYLRRLEADDDRRARRNWGSPRDGATA